MRSLNYISGMFMLAICLLASCKKDHLLKYNIEDNVYFKYAPVSGFADSVNFSFGYSPLSVKDSVFKIPVYVTGSASDHDRTYNVSVVPGVTTAVEGTHYAFPAKAIFRAGRIADSLQVKLIRAADLQQKDVTLTLHLTPGEELKTNVTSFYTNIAGERSVLNFKINVSDQVSSGNGWTSAFAPYFGTFSVKKIRLINEVTGMPLDYVTMYVYDLSSIAQRTVYAIAFSNYLKEQKNAGHTVYEDDGITEMTVGAAYQ